MRTLRVFKITPCEVTERDLASELELFTQSETVGRDREKESLGNRNDFWAFTLSVGVL